MSESCNKSCSTCGEDRAERESQPKSLLENPHECSDIKKVIAVVSGKGRVGKSLVASMLAVSMNRKGYQTAILDADVTGPSVPKLGILPNGGLKSSCHAHDHGHECH